MTEPGARGQGPGVRGQDGEQMIHVMLDMARVRYLSIWGFGFLV